jgi:outer membrane immunogenic protein
MKAFVFTAAALLTATTTFAADAISSVPEAPVATDISQRGFEWTGGYAGIQAGYGWLDGTFDAGAAAPGTDPLEGDLDGGTLGLFAGYNHQFNNNVVLGIDANVDYNWNDTTMSSVFGDVDGKAEWQGSVRGRLGYAVDRALIYVAAGYVGTRAEADNATLGSASETFHGYTVGAGVDYALTDRVFGRLDYRFNDFGSKDLDFSGTAVDSDLSQHSVKLGVGVKF